MHRQFPGQRPTVLLALLSIGVAASHTSAAPQENDAPLQQPPNAQRPVVIRLRGPIFSITQAFVERQIETAKTLNADLIIFDIDSPGGEAQASMNIAEAIARIDWATTAAFIENEALSGAAFVAIGCQDILMRTNAKIGDAGPIVVGEDSLFRHAPEKIVSILAAEIRDVAIARGHPPAIAVAMVDKNSEVFFYRNKVSGQILCMSPDELKSRDDAKDWEQGRLVPGSQRGRFLTLNGKDALEVGLAAATIDTMQDLKVRYGFEQDPPVFQFTWVDTLVAILNSPLVTGILLVVGLVCLYLELYTAGLGLFGLLSGLSFALFFWSRFLGGTADWLEILLFIGGVACLATELFLLPGFGVFGISGILLVLASLTLAGAPTSGRLVNQFDAIASSALVVAASLAAFIIVGLILGRFMGALPIFQRMALAPPATSVEDIAAPQANTSPYSALLGTSGAARTPLRPAGKARLDGNDYDVVAEGAFIAIDRPVRVVLVRGNRIVVREVEESA